MSFLSDSQAVYSARNTLVDNLNTKGVEATTNDSLETLAGKVLNVTPTLQSKSVTITANGNTSVTPDTGYDGLSSVAITTNVGGGENKLAQILGRTVTSLTASDLQDVTTIGGYAFYYCNRLNSIVLPNSLTTISDYGFYGCTGLRNITIPSSVQSIGNMAFCQCSMLSKVVFEGSMTQIIGFNYDPITLYDFRNFTVVPTLVASYYLGHASNCKIVVPDALYDDWIIATNWSSITGVVWVKASDYVE